MAATTTAPPREVLGALEIIKRHFDLNLLVEVFTEAGINSATAYRRIKKPVDLSLGELTMIGDRYNVPPHVITEGQLATLRYLREEHPSGPGTPSDLPGKSFPCMSDHPTWDTSRHLAAVA